MKMNFDRRKWIRGWAASCVVAIFAPVFVWAGPRNTTHYNLSNGVALKGYDPVAVFAEGGGQARAGRADIALDYEGVTYYFANVENRDQFLRDPERFEPTYGGWCAYAMASGAQVDIDPKLYTLNGRRAHYFVSSRAKKNFDADVESFEKRADEHWKMISGEDPRR